MLAVEVANKYKVKETFAEATSATYHKLNEINHEYKVTDKVTETSQQVAKQAIEFDQKYGISKTAGNVYIRSISSHFLGILIIEVVCLIYLCIHSFVASGNLFVKGVAAGTQQLFRSTTQSPQTTNQARK